MGPITLVMDGSTLQVIFDINGKEDPDIDRVKKVRPRLRFLGRDKGGPLWYGKADLETCRSLRAAFGDRLRVRNDVSAWAREAAKAEERLTTLALSTAADVPAVELKRLPHTAPALYGTLRATQRAAVAYAVDAGSFLLADDAGFGKTLEAEGVLGEMDLLHPDANVLIIGGRKIAGRTWEREAARWLPGVKVFRAERGNVAKRQRTIDAWDSHEGPAFLYVNAAMLRSWRQVTDDKGKKLEKPKWDHAYPELFERGLWDAIILDESHKVLQKTKGTYGSREGEIWYEQNPKGRWGDMRKRRKGSMQGMGAMLLSLWNTDAVKVAMTATPNPNKTEGIFGTLRWCFPDRYTSYWNFVNAHFHVDEDRWGHKRIRELNEDELAALYRKLNTVMIRRTKMEDPELNLIPKTYVDVWVDMEGKQEEQYRKFQEQGRVLMEGGTLAMKGRLSAITRARQLAHGAMKIVDGKPRFLMDQSCVLEAVLELLDTRGILEGEGHQKVLVWSELEEFVDLICAKLDQLSVPYFKLVGDTSDKERDYIQDRFQEPGGPRVVVGTTSTGGISVTLDAADAVIMCDEMWNWDDNEQAEDRAHRASRRHNVTVYYIRTAGTVYEYVANVVGGKWEEAKQLLDGRRGVETARQMMEYKGSTDKEAA